MSSTQPVSLDPGSPAPDPIRGSPARSRRRVADPQPPRVGYRPQLFTCHLPIGTQIEYIPMSTQPQFPNPGRQAPARSRRRVRPPRDPASSDSSNQHPRPTAVPRQSAPPNPPSPRLPTRPSHLVRTAPSTAPDWPKSAPPAPSRVFWKKLLHAHNTPASSSRTQQYSPIRHPGVFSRDPAATSKPGSPCHPVNPASPASPSRETRPAHRPSQRPSRRRRLANSPKKTASSYLWPAGPLWGPAGQR